VVIPGRHKMIAVPVQELLDILAGTSIVANYKALL